MLEGVVDFAVVLFDRYGLFGLFLIILIGSSPVPVPVDLVVATVVALGAPPIPSAVFAGFGASLGAIIIYYIGYGLITATHFVEKQKDKVEQAHGWLEKYGAPAIFIFALTPLPYDAMALVAGGARMNLKNSTWQPYWGGS